MRRNPEQGTIRSGFRRSPHHLENDGTGRPLGSAAAFSLPTELGNVRAACRLIGRPSVDLLPLAAPVLRSGLDMLRPRERRPPRMPNQTSQVVEARIVAFSLGHPGLGPRRISATLAQERWGGLVVSPNGVWRVLRRHGLNRRISRFARGRLCQPAGSRAIEAHAERHLEVDHPASSSASTASRRPPLEPAGSE